MSIKEIIQQLRVTMDDAKGQDSHFDSWLTQNEGICKAIDALKILDTQPLPVQEPDRRALQAEGKHPAPCARHCEAKAFEIEIRSLKSALKQAQPEPPTCAWSPEDDDTMPGTYRSACGELWSFIDGGWQDNNVRFCHGCGGKVVAAHNIKEQP